MPARRYYLDENGKKVRIPSVTGILRNYGDPGGLLYWANQAGLDGLTLEEAREDATSIGTIAHAMIEADAKGEALDLAGLPPAYVEGARTAHAVFVEWRDRNQYRLDHAECSLVSMTHRYGGTFDAVLVGDRRELVDWKTSRAIYPDHFIQVAAYGILWEEHHPDEPVEGYRLLRLGKHEASFSDHYQPATSDLMAACREQFLLLRRAYDLGKEIKKRAG